MFNEHLKAHHVYLPSPLVKRTSGQSNLTQGRIAAEDGRFTRIRQVGHCAFSWGHTGAPWRIRL